MKTNTDPAEIPGNVIVAILATSWLKSWKKSPSKKDAHITNGEAVKLMDGPNNKHSNTKNAIACLRAIEQRKECWIIFLIFLLILPICYFAHHVCKVSIMEIQKEIGMSGTQLVTFFFPAIAIFVFLVLVYTLRNLVCLRFSPSTYFIGSQWKKTLNQIDKSGLLKALQESLTGDKYSKVKESLRRTNNGVVTIDTDIHNWLFNVYTQHITLNQARDHVLNTNSRTSRNRNTEKRFEEVLQLGPVFKSPHEENELRALLYSKARKFLQSEGIL